MVRNTPANRSPWEDRWSQPTAEQLLATLKPHHTKLLGLISEHLLSLEGVRSEVIWYGTAWKWTVSFPLTDSRGRQLDTLCHLVPNRELPLVSVPMSVSFIEHLPMKRLKKYVRDGIRGGRFAVAIHWASWTPNNQADVLCLADLFKRKHKFLTSPPSTPALPSAAK